MVNITTTAITAFGKMNFIIYMYWSKSKRKVVMFANFGLIYIHINSASNQKGKTKEQGAN